MWNLERTAVISEKIKAILPDTLIVWGGPEVQKDIEEYRRCCDVFFIGEGELIFTQFVSDYINGVDLPQFYISREPVDLNALSNPYIEGILVPQKGGAMLVETMRGCIYPCKYCFYSKSFKGLRFFPENQLEEIFRIACSHDVSEIYLMDPSFNCSKDLVKRLKEIGKLNNGRMNIHTEIRLEAVTEEIAICMAEAGIKSVEVGLQSVNDNVLKTVGRGWHREKFVKGAELLIEKGIDVKTGVIMGLPGEDLNGFMKTLDFVMENRLEEAMEIYPLSLIPGTVLRDISGDLGMEYMKCPPYWVLDSNGMDEREIRYAIEMVEHKLDIEFHPPVVPFFRNISDSYTFFMDLRHGDFNKKSDEFHKRLPGNSLTVIIDNGVRPSELEELGNYLAEQNSSTLLQIILDYEDVPDESICNKLAEYFSVDNTYFDSIHYFKTCRQKSHKLRFFHLTEDVSLLEEEQYCDTVIKYRSGMLDTCCDELEAFPLLLVDSSVEEEEIVKLKEFYSDFDRFLILL